MPTNNVSMHKHRLTLWLKWYQTVSRIQ